MAQDDLCTINLEIKVQVDLEQYMLREYRAALRRLGARDATSVPEWFWRQVGDKVARRLKDDLAGNVADALDDVVLQFRKKHDLPLPGEQGDDGGPTDGAA